MFEKAVQYVTLSGNDKKSLGTVSEFSTLANIEIAYTTIGKLYRKKGDTYWFEITPPSQTSPNYEIVS